MLNRYVDGLTSKETVDSVKYGDTLTGEHLEKYKKRLLRAQEYIEKALISKKAVIDQAKINSLANTDSQAIKVKSLYLNWENDQVGYEYDIENPKDKRRNFGGYLWNLNKSHKKQEGWFPGSEPALWTQINESTPVLTRSHSRARQRKCKRI